MGIPPSYTVSGADRERLASAFTDPDSARPVSILTGDGVFELPPAAADAVRQLLVDLASGASVHVLAENIELTTQEAANVLGISRTYLVRLIDQGAITAHLVGTHRRVRVADVLAYQARRDDRLRAVASVTDEDAAAGIPYR